MEDVGERDCEAPPDEPARAGAGPEQAAGEHRVARRVLQEERRQVRAGMAGNVGIFLGPFFEKKKKKTNHPPPSSRHGLYGKHYLYCLFMSLLNLVVQVILTNLFLGGSFLAYGFTFTYTTQDRSSRIPMQDILFPKMAKSVWAGSADAAHVISSTSVAVPPFFKVSHASVWSLRHQAAVRRSLRPSTQHPP